SIDKNDNYNIPLEYSSDEEECVRVPIIKEVVPSTCQKVVEVYEMNEAEINIANKIRYISKLCFEGFFRGDNVRAWCSGLYAGFVAYDLIKENYVAAIILFGCCLIYTDVNVGFKVLKDYFTSKRREELEQDLQKYGVLEYTNAIKSLEDVKTYIKYRRMN
ncbi:MAG: hypothetical protein K2H20_01385, partial [Bacilli bacterium]|nr:hypothetical protein [Bacilli bacterium]